MKRILLVLLMAAPCWAANVFTGDPNCVALWRFESGALDTDTIGNNDLTSSNLADSASYKEGSNAVQITYTTSSAVVADANLDSGYPFKSGGTQRNISVCFWAYYTGIGNGRRLYGKYAASAGNRSFGIIFDTTQDTKIYVGYNSGNSAEILSDTSTTLVANQWYHVGVTFDTSKNWRIRIWDDTGSSVGETSGTATNSVYISAIAQGIGSDGDAAAGWGSGKLDELVVFNDVLTAEQIDMIRSGTYGAPTGPIEGNAFMSTYNPN